MSKLWNFFNVLPSDVLKRLNKEITNKTGYINKDTLYGLNFEFKRDWIGHKVSFTGRREDENDVNTVLKCEILNKNFKYKK